MFPHVCTCMYLYVCVCTRTHIHTYFVYTFLNLYLSIHICMILHLTARWHSIPCSNLECRPGTWERLPRTRIQTSPGSGNIQARVANSQSRTPVLFSNLRAFWPFDVRMYKEEARGGGSGGVKGQEQDRSKKRKGEKLRCMEAV